MSENEPKTLGWMIVELLGHRKLGGHVREETIAGHGFLRIDVFHREGTEPVATQFVAPGSIYAITPTTEKLAREVAEACAIQPVARWELPQERLPERTTDRLPLIDEKGVGEDPDRPF